MVEVGHLANNNINEHVKGRIITSDNFLTQNECNRLIDDAENGGFKPSALSGGGHGRTGREGARTSQFYVKDDVDFANILWKRVKSWVPSNLRDIKPVPYMSSVTRGDEYKAIGVNEHLRFYKYNVGQHILKHDDYRMSRYRYDPNQDKYYYQMTFFTLLIYLNDEFQEGQTTFWTKYATEGVVGHCRFIRDLEFTEADLKITPKTGRALINDHMVQHEGEAPKKGIKYIMRTDIVHEREIEKGHIDYKFKKNQLLSGWTRHYEPSCLNYTE